MKKDKYFLKILSVFILLGLFIGAYIILIRPWHLNWGATDKEIAQFMPGDDLFGQIEFNATRVVTINASPEEIWPWIVQMGHHRIRGVGFYSYDWFDNGFVRSAEQIKPEYQNMSIGDEVPVSSLVSYTVRMIEPYESIVWVGGGDEITGAWTWGLQSLDDGKTRLITRLRGDYDWSSPLILMNLWIDWGDFAFMRKSMLGIQQRAEGNITDTLLKDTLEGVLWFGTLFIFISAVVQIFRRDDWHRPWIMAFGIGVIFLIIFYLRPPLFISGILEAGLLITLIRWR